MKLESLIPWSYIKHPFKAGIAQLVERNLAKVEVASSNLVSRSRFQQFYSFALIRDDLQKRIGPLKPKLKL